MESGELDLAIARFKSALARYPNKMQLIYDYPQALAKAGRTRDAVAFLETELARFPHDGPLHRIAARTYAELGQKQQEHRHQGEFYAWQGDFKGAVRQLELASRRATATSIRRRSSRRACARCARSSPSSRRRSARTAECRGWRPHPIPVCALASATCNFRQVPTHRASALMSLARSARRRDTAHGRPLPGRGA